MEKNSKHKSSCLLADQKSRTLQSDKRKGQLDDHTAQETMEKIMLRDENHGLLGKCKA